MSTSKLDTSGVFQPVTVQGQKIKLALSPNAVRVRKNGIEFLSASALPLWAELTVSLQSPLDGRKINARGVVVECNGNRHSGYSISLLFMDLSPQAQERLNTLAFSSLA
jgi:hypothetical protein